VARPRPAAESSACGRGNVVGLTSIEAIFLLLLLSAVICFYSTPPSCGSVAKWLACWTQAQKGPGSNRSRDAVG